MGRPTVNAGVKDQNCETGEVISWLWAAGAEQAGMQWLTSKGPSSPAS